MLNKQPSQSEGNHYINKPKEPSKYIWRMEAAFIILAIMTVISVSFLLYITATNNKKSKDAANLSYSALSTSAGDDSQVIAKNEPAVVRIASVYCPNFDLRLSGVTQNFSGGCTAGYGSGFIISPEGYLATNGHVIKSPVGEVLATSIELGNLGIIKSYLNFLVKTKLVSQATADDYYGKASNGDESSIKAIVASISDPALEKTEVKENETEAFYAVQLSRDSVSINPKNLKALNYGKDIIGAKLIDLNYDPYSNVAKDGFNGSDVAILKLDSGSNYPFIKLGSLLGVSQGSKLTVMGFPGSAENELVNKDVSTPTSTQGTVSSIRNANGTNNKLIQTDASIAKGNSGGPAFDKNGDAIGLATYKVSDDSTGGNVNYLRDIQDLKDLLDKNGIKVPKDSIGNQLLWEQALSKFNKAYYTSAIADFKRVKTDYPQNTLVDNFIARAEEAKTKGKEVTDPSIYIIIIGLSVVFIFIPTIIMFFVISHHHKRREAHDKYLKQASRQKPERPAALRVNSASQAPSTGAQRPARNVDMLSHAQEPPKKV